MKLRTLIMAMGGVGLMVSQLTYAADKVALQTQQDKVSYSIGFDMGKTFKSQDININPTILAEGLKNAYSGGKTLMSEKEVQDTLMNFQKELIAKQETAFKDLAEKNEQVGSAYQAKIKSETGWTTLPSGLQYKVVSGGEGLINPTATDVVTVEYTGTLIDGKVFDSTKDGKPVSFPVNGVIPGWQEAITLMKQGATWDVVIPPKLAYGKTGLGGPIGPNETLKFKIHLVSIEKPQNAQTTNTGAGAANAAAAANNAGASTGNTTSAGASTGTANTTTSSAAGTTGTTTTSATASN